MDKTALIVVDLQNDYFPGGAFEQENAEKAVRKGQILLNTFRERGLPVFHVRHESLRPEAGFLLPGTKGAEIHPLVIPVNGEKVILKHYPNSFRETGLEGALRDADVKRVVVIGMMTLMCIDATVRAAFDLGFEVVVAHDACAARSLEFEGTTVPAAHVHAAFLAALGMVYADVTSVASLKTTL
ncbi:cysteine hydrolase family protein [Pseudodesulfovibrio sediminis]|uniref:Isochorismatase n=1 Tax=Pseudodesulfovibrio sediminis TaxID=2810563 RepID=A0ABM7P333_9BACT|nr:cysteine hydrolase family protein [Pseudodesulfovibrio sediminis]BCS87257.1 isochorismatase [Pseudodesulfovibrio sediminis]